MGIWSKLTGVLGGAASGALPGFMMGGPYGALAGGALGALGGATAKSGKYQQQPTVTPEQKATLDELLRSGAADVSAEGQEKRAMDQFQREIVPQLAAQFEAMGGSGGRSSAFGETMGGAGADLASQLASLRSQVGMQKLGLGMSPQFQTSYMKGQPGIGQESIGQLMPLLGMQAMMGGGLPGLSGFGNKGGAAKGGPLYAKGQPAGYTGSSPLAGLTRLWLGGR